MKAPKITPGEWRFGDYGAEVYADGGKIIACCGDGPDYTEEPDPITEANARLIAAAPNLAEALNAILECYPQSYKCEYGSAERVHFELPDWEQVAKQARAALIAAGWEEA